MRTGRSHVSGAASFGVPVFMVLAFIGLDLFARPSNDLALPAAGVDVRSFHRLLTYAVVHTDIGHVLVNAAFLLLLGCFAVERVGVRLMLRAVVAGVLAGAGVYLAAFPIVGGNGFLGGMSTGIAGIGGLIVVHLVVRWRAGSRCTPVLVVALVPIIPLGSLASVLAHFGGFLGGLLVGNEMTATGPREPHRRDATSRAVSADWGRKEP